MAACMTKVSKQDITNAVAATTGLTKSQVANVLEAVFAEVKNQVVAGQEVSVYGFGTFAAVATAERQAHNPANLEKVIVPAGKRIKFKASSTFKQELKAA